MQVVATGCALAAKLPGVPPRWRSAGDRLGRLDASSQAMAASAPAIWVHAASVGELTAVRPLLGELRERFPGRVLVVSTLTRTGLALAREMPEAHLALLFPLGWSYVAIYVLDSFLFAALPAVLFLSAVTAWTGWIFFAFWRRVRAPGAGLLAGALFLWAVHHLDYPFLRARGAWAPWGYYLDIALMLATAGGITTPKTMMAIPTTSTVMVCPSPQMAPMKVPCRNRSLRLRMVVTAITWSASVAWRMPSRNPNPARASIWVMGPQILWAPDAYCKALQ